MTDDEVANSLTHGLGLILSVIGCYVLITSTAARGETRQTAACCVFGGSLVALYAASTLYHSVRRQGLKRLLRLVDHACIFGLIAGTYTPLCLVALRGRLGWAILAVVWGVAVAGTCWRVAYRSRIDELSSWPYLAMGWLVLVDLGRLHGAIGMGGLAWLAAGGLCYTAGLVFFVRDEQPLFHAVWHLFTVAGSACHYVAVLVYVIRGTC